MWIRGADFKAIATRTLSSSHPEYRTSITPMPTSGRNPHRPLTLFCTELDQPQPRNFDLALPHTMRGRSFPPNCTSETGLFPFLPIHISDGTDISLTRLPR
jgi:hypothetical protein